ncbi:MAG: hypothetical protein J6X38_06425, partial [Abditibacteriota bacterium]|nr:hypothetical protein [Abditibacteriota bacterium]
AVVTNKEGGLASAGYIIDVQAEVQNEQIPESDGPVVLEANLAGSLALNLGSNDVTFPSSYDDYVSLNEIINNFLPSGEDEGEEEKAGFSLDDLGNLAFDLSGLSGLTGLFA